MSHQTSGDTFDHLWPDDLRQAAAVPAAVLLGAAISEKDVRRNVIPEARRLVLRSGIGIRRKLVGGDVMPPRNSIVQIAALLHRTARRVVMQTTALKAKGPLSRTA